MYRQKRILVVWYTDPRYIPPFVLSDRQVTIGPKISADQPQEPFDGFTPRRRYDLFAALESLRLPTEFDAVVVWADATGANEPINLEAFGCPKILCIGDTHHLEKPLQKMIDYQNAAKFDYILSSHNRHHLHWFIEAGFSNVAWLPGIKVQNLSRPFSGDRTQEVCFFGSAGKTHPRRTYLLREFSQRKPVPFSAMYGRRDHAADRYSTSAVSLNCSLNGDLNLRVFEILAAGGCLLTDRLSPQSGLDLLLKEEKEFMSYDSVEECIERARFLLAHPQSALSMARAGNDAFIAQMLPEHRAQQLFDWVFQGRLDSLFRLDDLPQATSRDVESLRDRIQIYEQLQELNRVTQSGFVLFMNDVPDIYVLDALDLCQLKIVIDENDDSKARAKPHAIQERCTRMSPAQLAATSWHCVVASRDGTVPEFIQYKKLIRSSVVSPKAQTS